MRIALLNDTEAHGNWGSQACAVALKGILREACRGSEIVSLPSSLSTARYRRTADWLGAKIYEGPNRLFDKYSTSFYGEPAFADDFEAASKEWREGRGGPFAEAVLRALDGADVVVFNAEGSTYRTNVSAIRCLFALWVARHELRIPAVFLNGSVMLTFVDPVLPAIVGRVFRSLDGIALREPASVRNVREFVPDARVTLVPDSAFRLALDEPAETTVSRPAAGAAPYFCVSSSMLHSIVPAPLRFGIGQTALLRLVERLQKVVPGLVVLARDKEDLELMTALARSAGGRFVGPEHTVRDVMSILRGAQFLVSGRYHHIIFASVAGCPSIPLLTTSHKVDGLCELLDGLVGSPEDPTDLGGRIEAIAARAERLLDEGDALRSRLKTRASQLCADAGAQGEIVLRATQARRGA